MYVSVISDCIKEDTECIKDKLSYDAISCLHRLIDDDHNGNVDQSESDEARYQCCWLEFVDVFCIVPFTYRVFDMYVVFIKCVLHIVYYSNAGLRLYVQVLFVAWYFVLFY